MASSRDGQGRYGAQLQLIRVYNNFLSLENRIANSGLIAVRLVQWGQL